MKANLSLVYDERGEIYCNLVEGKEINELDEYTTKFPGSDEIRKRHAETIRKFKEQNPNLAMQKGRLVILYPNEKDENVYYKLRVLYRANRNKTNPTYVLEHITALLKKESKKDLPREVIEKHPYIFNSSFVKDTMKRLSTKAFLSTRENNQLIRLLNEAISNKLARDYDRGYFYIRKVDSFLERKKNYQTTEMLEEIKEVHQEPTSSILEDIRKNVKGRVRMAEIPLIIDDVEIREGASYIRDFSLYQEEIEPSVVTRKPRETLKAKNLSTKPTREAIIEEYLKNGERASMSDIDLEYRERLNEWKEQEDERRK